MIPDRFTKTHRWGFCNLLSLCVGLTSVLGCSDTADRVVDAIPRLGEPVALPALGAHANPFDAVLAKRSSRREFANEEIGLEVIGSLCWAGQGLNDHGSRTAPSAGGLYPLSLYVVRNSGTSRYIVDDHALQPWLSDDRRAALKSAALNQSAVGNAAVCFVITYDVSITAAKYGSRAERFCQIEVGHAAQNILLKATDLELSAVPIGGFEDDEVAKAIRLPKNHTPAYILAIGKPATGRMR